MLLEQFLHVALSFPTVMFSVLLVLSLLYWLFVIVGAVDIDLFGSADGVAEGAAEGSVEGVKEGIVEGLKEGAMEGIKEGVLDGLKEGVAEGLKEGIFEGIKEGVAEGIKEGVAEGLAEGATEGLAEGAAEGSVEGAKSGMADSAAAASGKASFLATVFGALKLRSAPVTVVMSVFVLAMWGISAFTMHLGAPMLPSSVPTWVLSIGVLTLGSLVSLLITSVAVRPLAPVFTLKRELGQHTLIGRELVITTLNVTNRFGQATPVDTDLILSVRCPEPNGLTKGSRALIIDYDKVNNVYHIEPMDQFLPERPKTLDEELNALAEVHETVHASKEA